MCTAGKPVEKCKNSPSKNGKVAKYRKMFLFVNDIQPDPPKNSGVKRVNPGTTNCPWEWDVDIDSARRPISIATAKCTPDLNCDKNKCREIAYSHKVLRQHKDCNTGEMVWKWEFQTFPIAYVYNV